MFQYEHPEFLDLLWCVPVLALLLFNYWRWRSRSLRLLGEPNKVQGLIAGYSERRFLAKSALLLGVFTLFLCAFANPQRGAKMQKVTQNSSDIFIALDISQSMWAQDVAPSRLELAKAFIQKLVQALDGERIGLIFFAGNAFLQLPLSTDYGFILESVQNAGPELVTDQGTAIQSAIELASSSFDPEPSGRALILITDGENHDEDIKARAETAFSDGMVLYPVGVGTSEGGPIPLPGTGVTNYKRDEAGEIVVTKLDQKLLLDMASAGGGRSFNVSQGDAAIRALKKEMDGLKKRELEVRSISSHESYYQWFLLPGILLLLLDLLIQWRKSTIKTDG
jgi:Ca-activated chloride channel family protein